MSVIGSFCSVRYLFGCRLFSAIYFFVASYEMDSGSPYSIIFIRCQLQWVVSGSGVSTGGAIGAAAPPKEAVFGGKIGILVKQMGIIG